MRVAFVTGGTGFLGQYLVPALVSAGYQVHSLVRSSDEPLHQAVGIKGDITSSALDLSAISGAEIVVHAAGKAHMVPRTEEEKQAFFLINVEGTKHLLRAMEAWSNLPKQFVFISTVSVYGRDSGSGIAERDSLDTTEPYGISKIEAENLCKEWCASRGIPCLIVRPPLLVGYNPPGNLGKMLDALRKGKYRRIGKGDANKSMVLASDLSNFIAQAQGLNGTYNFTDGHHPSFRALEECLVAQLKLKKPKVLPKWVVSIAAVAGQVLQTITRKQMPINNRMYKKITFPLTFDDSKARAEIGWAPRSVLSHLNELVEKPS